MDRVADRVLVINGGRVVSDGPVSMSTHVDTCVVRGKDNKLLTDTLEWSGICVQERADGYLVAHAPKERVSDVAFEANVRITGLREDERSLEDVFSP